MEICLRRILYTAPLFSVIHPSETMSAVQNCSETYFFKAMPDMFLGEMGCTHGAPPGGWHGYLKHKTKQKTTTT